MTKWCQWAADGFPGRVCVATSPWARGPDPRRLVGGGSRTGQKGSFRGLWEGAPGCPSGPLINMDTGSAGAGATLCRGCTEFIRKRPFLPAKGGPGGLVRTAASRAGCGGPVSQGTCSPGQAWDCSMKNGHRGAGGQRSRRAARHNINGIISGAEHFHTPRAFAHIY